MAKTREETISRAAEKMGGMTEGQIATVEKFIAATLDPPAMLPKQPQQPPKIAPAEVIYLSQFIGLEALQYVRKIVSALERAGLMKTPVNVGSNWDMMCLCSTLYETGRIYGIRQERRRRAAFSLQAKQPK